MLVQIETYKEYIKSLGDERLEKEFSKQSLAEKIDISKCVACENEISRRGLKI